MSSESIKQFIDKCLEEPFVSRLSKLDFECFLNPRDHDDAIIRSVYDEESQHMKIYMQNSPQTPIIFTDYEVKYDFSKLKMSEEISKSYSEAENHIWEIFMTKKFGKEYAKKLDKQKKEQKIKTHQITNTTSNKNQTKVEKFYELNF